MTAQHSILIVEVDYFQSHVMNIMLNKLNYNVVGMATSGESAIVKAIDLKPDLVIMDFALDGEMDGIEAGIQINKKAEDTILIYVSGCTDESHIKRMEQTEYHSFLSKPIDREILTETLKSCFSNKAQVMHNQYQ
ncbi:MAG: response regulator [Balneolaceae bacterium]|nr:response regulator [Balneolaceae bacterium]